MYLVLKNTNGMLPIHRNLGIVHAEGSTVQSQTVTLVLLNEGR